MAQVVQIPVNFDEEKTRIQDFLSKIDISQAEEGGHLQIPLDLLQETDLYDKIMANPYRFANLFYQVVDTLLPQNGRLPDDQSNPLDVLIYHRRQRQQDLVLPLTLTRHYSLSFTPPTSEPELSIRQVTGKHVGKMVKIRGIVTRVSNVKPLLQVAAYACDTCGYEIFQDVTTQQWTPMSKCESEQCKKNNTKGVLHLQTRGCKFIKFQEVKIQELTEQIPMGHIPRYMTLHLINEQTRKVTPGETIVIGGIVLPVPYTGFKALKAGLITDVYVEVHDIVQTKARYSDLVATDEINSEIQDIHSSQGAYHRLASSIAPEIFGHEDIKKALLLMLVAGGSKETTDGMKVRGDINICLMGDPGVAKSQLLKHITKIAPRAIYTTGRGSSGVGLTASVVRDPVTDEMVLEGGALVLADNGIACIDEFDKMDDSDRTAIHEVMEQQTISISKAGITTTLNARTSILAAANPQFGRYNTKMKPTDNINLPAALLSRFDLLFLLLDRPSIEDDLRLAQHVTFVHRTLRHPQQQQEFEPVDPSLIKHYISKAKQFSPTVPAHVADYVVSAYVHMRKNASETAEFQYTSARTLLSIIRLASALARLRFSTVIEIFDVDEALRLIDVSKASLLQDKPKIRKDKISAIFDYIKQLATRADGTLARSISMASVQEFIISKGYTQEDLDKCIQNYQQDDVWMVAANGSQLRWMRIEEDSDEEL
ncbi:MCM2/3/5 family-domain-containing protein [Gorgonomyces haynaldii]|nr:MCM2/3/5 family-domain-containing protein [Gorgonomyces haynaldii]